MLNLYLGNDGKFVFACTVLDKLMRRYRAVIEGNCCSEGSSVVRLWVNHKNSLVSCVEELQVCASFCRLVEIVSLRIKHTEWNYFQ